MRHARPGQSEPGADNPTKVTNIEIYPSPTGKINRAAAEEPPTHPGRTSAAALPGRRRPPRGSPTDGRVGTSKWERSLPRGAGTSSLQFTAPLLGVQPSLSRPTARFGGPTSAWRWRGRLGQRLRHPFHGHGPVPGLGTVLLHTHGEHTVHQTPGQAFQGTLTPGPPQTPAGGHVDRQRHPGRGGVDVLPTGAGGAGKTPPEVVGGDGHRSEDHVAPGLVRSHCPHLPFHLRAESTRRGPAIRAVAPRTQCAASCQFCPPPTDTANGTRRS